MKEIIKDGGPLSHLKLCQVCNKPFEFYRWRDKYCSDKCRNKKYKYKYKRKINERFEKTCEQCMAIFRTNDHKKKYCSVACYQQHFITVYVKVKQKELRCVICEKVFHSAHQSKKYCSPECYSEAAKRRKHGS